MQKPTIAQFAEAMGVSLNQHMKELLDTIERLNKNERVLVLPRKYGMLRLNQVIVEYYENVRTASVDCVWCGYEYELGLKHCPNCKQERNAQCTHKNEVSAELGKICGICQVSVNVQCGHIRLKFIHCPDCGLTKSVIR